MSKALKEQSSLYSVIVPDEIKRGEARGFLNDSEIQMAISGAARHRSALDAMARAFES